MCRVLEIHPSGFYGWLKQPESKRATEDKRLPGQIKQFWIVSLKPQNPINRGSPILPIFEPTRVGCT